MAEDKKSIIVYADWIDTFEGLSDDEAGKLIKHFFRYVNDKNPTAPDRITDLLFIPLKQSLKRDLKKWEKTLDDRSINGRIGNLKRWNLDLYNDVIAERTTLEEAEVIAKDRKASLPDKNNRPPTGSVANVADSVSVNVSVNDILLEKETKVDLIDWNGLLNQFNTITGRKFKTVTKKTKSAFTQRLKEGYSKGDILKAIKNANKHEFHQNNNNQYLTLEYISRAEKMEFYCTDVAATKKKLPTREIGML